MSEGRVREQDPASAKDPGTWQAFKKAFGPRLQPESVVAPKAATGERPPWDRTTDVVYCQAPSDAQQHLTDGYIFQRSTPLFLGKVQRGVGETYPTIGYLGLPGEIRFCIAKHLVAACVERTSSGKVKPIALTNARSREHMYPREHHASLKKLLKALEPFMQTSFGCFADTMLAILLTQSFHSIYSPWTNTYCDLITAHWYPRYGQYIRHLTLEVDFTRLGFGPSRAALKLASGTVNLETFIDKFVDVQIGKIGTVKELTVCCRRFYGFRPDPSTLQLESGDKAKLPYCPDRALRVCDSIFRLRGLVAKIRIAGFSEDYTGKIISEIFMGLGGLRQPQSTYYHIAPSDLWPRMPNQKSYIDLGQGEIRLDDHNSPLRLPGLNQGPNAAPSLKSYQRSAIASPAFDIHRKAARGRIASLAVDARKASFAESMSGIRTRVASLSENIASLTEKVKAKPRTTGHREKFTTLGDQRNAGTGPTQPSNPSKQREYSDSFGRDTPHQGEISYHTNITAQHQHPLAHKESRSAAGLGDRNASSLRQMFSRVNLKPEKSQADLRHAVEGSAFSTTPEKEGSPTGLRAKASRFSLRAITSRFDLRKMAEDRK